MHGQNDIAGRLDDLEIDIDEILAFAIGANNDGLSIMVLGQIADFARQHQFAAHRFAA